MANLSTLSQAILNDLLTRAEKPERQRVVRLRLNERDHASYFSPNDGGVRRETNTALRQLEAEQVVRLHWRKWEENNWLTAVDLQPQQSEKLYNLLERTPRAMQDNVLRQLLEAQPQYAGWHADFISWALAQLDAHRSVAPLERDQPATNTDILRALSALAVLQAPTLERILSVQLFDDSKRLALLRGAMLRVLRRHDPNAGTFEDDDWALLRAHQLDRVPEYVPLAGAVQLQLQPATELLNLSLFAPSVALSAAMLQHISVAAVHAKAVITVENATSFSELSLVRPPDIVILYTGGFASPTVIKLLQAIHTFDQSIALFHWGDMDAGGLRILAHLRSNLGVITPLAMDAITFTTHQAHAQTLTIEDQRALSTLREHSLLKDCVPLVECLLQAGQKLEQEAVSATTLVF